MKKINIILSVVIALLLVLCVASVYAPLRFDSQRSERETAVKRRLMQIRAAAERYRHDHGAYTGRLQTLVDSGYIADSLTIVPFSGGKRFLLEASSVATRSGAVVPVMECSATFDEYLNGLDQNSIRNLSVSAESAGRFAGLKIGSLESPNDNSGNWE